MLICRRLRQAREIAGVTQAELAQIVGIPFDRLSACEKGKAPLKCDLALRTCRQLIISEEWLATGQTQTFTRRFINFPDAFLNILKERVLPRYCLDLCSEPDSRVILPETLFSEAFDAQLATAYEQLAKRKPPLAPPRILFSTSVPEPELAARVVRVIFERQLLFLSWNARADIAPWPMQRLYAFEILGLCRELARLAWHADYDPIKFQEFIEPIHCLFAKFDDDQKERDLATKETEQRKNGLPGNVLAEANSKSTLRFMLWPELTTWDSVRTQLKQLLDSRRGAKAALARRVGVSTQAVSQWLSAASAPSRDTAFLIRKILADGTLLTMPEKKKSARTSAEARAPKTRRKSDHEKSEPKPNRKKQ